MSNDIAIRADNLGKMFLAGGHRGYKTFRDSLAGLFAPSVAHTRSRGEPFWALRGATFEITRGDVVGIVGRNGAGKSTLLKVLSRVTEPTEGSAEIHGRVGSLLEVGIGFHPELTGRENIFLNGAILGMRRAEIASKFDEIVEFAEVPAFIDTPVKHYSSGMYLRLAFAVAAHLETEILLVDEVLAVGDVQFQQKCVAKMTEVARQGRTVLFVSHNIGVVKTLCRSGILLSAGRVSMIGDVGSVVDAHQASMQARPGASAPNPHRVSLDRVQMLATRSGHVLSGESFAASVVLTTPQTLTSYYLVCAIQDQTGAMIVQSRMDEKQFVPRITAGTHTVTAAVPPLWLMPGVYTLQFELMIVAIGTTDRCLSDPLMVEVHGAPPARETRGVLAPAVAWRMRESSTAPAPWACDPQ